MGKYDRYQSKPKTRPWKIHPVWRGIGCVMIAMIPVMSYFGAVVLLDLNAQNGWVPIPVEFTGPAAYPYLYARLAVTIMLMFFGYGLLVILYTLLARISGMQQYGPLDSPPIRPKKNKRRR
jgi:hypothetical protein